MTKRSYLTGLILLGSWGLLAAQGPLRVSDGFESGSLGKWRLESDTHLVAIPRTDQDQDRVNSAITWFYAKLENVLQREVTIDLTGLDYTVYNGKKGEILPFERNTVPVFSYDGELWHRFTDCSFDKESRRLRIRQIFAADPVWIAYIVPYPLQRLESLLDEIRPHPAVRIETLGNSVEGRPLHLVTVEDPGRDTAGRPVAWIVARQHSFETGGTWAAEGFLRFLLSSHPTAVDARRRFTFRVCPMMNPDGVVNGGTRFNARGVDLNRHWHAEDPLSHDLKMAPEITLLKQALIQWKQSRRLDVWINLHNNDMVWNEDGDYIRFAPAGRETEAREFEKLLRQETIFTGPYDPTRDDKATEAVVAGATGALSLLMEMKTGFLEDRNRWTGKDMFLLHGEGMVRALAQFLDRR